VEQNNQTYIPFEVWTQNTWLDSNHTKSSAFKSYDLSCTRMQVALPPRCYSLLSLNAREEGAWPCFVSLVTQCQWSRVITHVVGSNSVSFSDSKLTNEDKKAERKYRHMDIGNFRLFLKMKRCDATMQHGLVSKSTNLMPFRRAD
jgi:hypothetical protein